MDNTNSKTYSKVDNREFFEWINRQLASDPQLTTNNLIFENQFKSFLSSNLPNDGYYYFGNTKAARAETLDYHINDLLGGPPDRVKKINENVEFLYLGVDLRAAVKGFIWIDTDGNYAIFGFMVYFLNSEIYEDGILVLFSFEILNILMIPPLVFIKQ